MQQRGAAKPPMSTAKKVGIAVVVLVCAPVVVSGVIDGAKQSAANKPAAAAPSTTRPASARPAPATSSPAAPTPAAAAAPRPTFVYPGDPQCAITYQDAGAGAMTWTVTTTVAGELITHASGTDGTIYRHDDQVTEGPHPYRAPVPLARINDVGGNLRAADGSSYGCSVAPQH